MGYKADIQATRATQASTNAVVAQPIRLKGDNTHERVLC
jgi:hypothetical protein